ncbi:MAG: hypothetical protein ACLP8S_07390, partial [Solirubrobacteraceae bacterium]
MSGNTRRHEPISSVSRRSKLRCTFETAVPNNFQHSFRRCPLAWLMLWTVRGRTVDVDDHENSSVPIVGISRLGRAR